MFIEIFNELLEERELNRKQFSEKSGIPYTTVIGWTKLNRLPDYTALIKIADFFNCSIDYIVGRQEDFNGEYSSMKINSIENTLLSNFRKLDGENRELILRLMKNLAEGQNKDN